MEGYKYISRKILQEEWFEKNMPLDFLEKLNEIIFDIESITYISNTNELYIYFKEHIKMERFIEENLDNTDIFDKFFEIFGILQRGLGWMEDMAMIAMVVGGVVALMKHLGGIDFILENLTSRINLKKEQNLE